MTQLQCRIQTSATGEISDWRDVSWDNHAKWDYREAVTRLEYVEIRVKPEFVPGYYRYIRAIEGGVTRNSVHYFSHGDVIDLEAFLEDYEPCTVTVLSE